MEWSLSNEALMRLADFAGVFAVLAVWEAASPRRRRELPRLVRWTGNLGIVVLDTILVRLLFPISAVALAEVAAACGWGTFNLLALPPWLAIRAHETNSNFGFNLPWWDRLLGTYRAQPAAGHEGMTIGIEQFRTPGDLRLDRMLLQPVRGAASGYPINREPGAR